MIGRPPSVTPGVAVHRHVPDHLRSIGAGSVALEGCRALYYQQQSIHMLILSSGFLQQPHFRQTGPFLPVELALIRWTVLREHEPAALQEFRIDRELLLLTDLPAVERRGHAFAVDPQQGLP